MSHITTWEINGLSLELDLEDANAAERYEDAFDKMDQEEKQLPKDGKLSAQIRAYCQLFVNLYDRIFGEGTGHVILGDAANTRICNDVYDKFLAFVSAQRTASSDQMNTIISKYSPNRAQRRAAAKGKGKPKP